MPTASGSAARAGGQRTAGLAMMGSAIALLVLAAATFGGMVPMDDAARPWAATGLGVAALLDLAVAVYFIRASTKS